MKRYAIYGAGSLGTVLGAYICKNGGQIDLINRNKAHVQALNANGAHITGTVDMTVPVKALLPDDHAECRRNFQRLGIQRDGQAHQAGVEFAKAHGMPGPPDVGDLGNDLVP